MSTSLHYTTLEGTVVQAFKGQTTIRKFHNSDAMQKFMTATDNANKSDYTAFCLYIAGLTNQYTPIETIAQLRKLAS